MSCATVELTRVSTSVRMSLTPIGGMICGISRVCPVEPEPPTPDDPSDTEDDNG